MRLLNTSPPPRLTSIAACLSGLFALGAAPHATLAAPLPVTNCNDHGAGSLRASIASASSGQTISLAGLSACTITLLTGAKGGQGALIVGISSLTITGPSSNSIAIDGSQTYPVFKHTGTGVLTLNHLVLQNGKYAGASAKGGCITSAGSVALTSSTVTGCSTHATTGKTKGGAIYAHGSVTLTDSTLSGNGAGSVGGAYGGAVVGGSIDAETSTFTNNQVKVPDGYSANPSNANFAGGALWSAGAITVNNSTFYGNSAVGPGTRGGCIFGVGTMYIGASVISNCRAYADYTSQGGAVYAGGALTVAHSVISTNLAGGSGGAYGGGFRAGSATVRYSTLHANSVGGGPSGFAGFFEGGGMFVYQGAATITNSTIDANSVGGTGGGVFGFHSNITISNSTISGNSAGGNGSVISSAGGGIAMQATPGTAATLKISNSTIAFNQAYDDFGTYGGAGVRAYGTATIQSSIIANNLKHGQPDDFSCECGIAAAPTISGSNNLIVALDPAGTPPPGGFVSKTTDPDLVPLSFHGGETRTHALNAASPAVNAGNNIGGFSHDQRGTGFVRNYDGTDIGAYERQQVDDEIFYNGLENQ